MSANEFAHEEKLHVAVAGLNRHRTGRKEHPASLGEQIAAERAALRHNLAAGLKVLPVPSQYAQDKPTN